MGIEIDFLGYAQDCRVAGRLRLDQPRLTDQLNADDSIRLYDVTVQDLRDGTSSLFDELEIHRDELTAVAVDGPRGDLERRVRTKEDAVEVVLDGFRARGMLHSPPAGDPFAAFERRPPMVPLTEASIDFDMGGERRTDRHETLLVNRAWTRAVRRSPRLIHAGP